MDAQGHWIGPLKAFFGFFMLDFVLALYMEESLILCLGWHWRWGS
jgi:hypothetical protein